MTVKLSLDAERDIEEIYTYSLINFGERKAEQYYQKLESKLLSIAETPYLGRDFGFVKTGVYRSNYISHSIYYQLIPSGILVLRVLHQQMDPARHL